MKEYITVRVDAKRITVHFLAIVLVLAALHILGRFFIAWGYPSVFGFNQLFDLDGEGNAPTYYSALSILFCAVLCAAISFIRKGKGLSDTAHWFGLAVILLFLSIDEACEIHETITGLIRLKYQTTGVFYSAWIIPYGIFLILFLAAYIRFWFRLPPQTKKQLFLAGFVYVSGVVGFEILGESFAEHGLHRSFGVLFCITMEEFLEMTGIVILIYALLCYIRSELGDEPPRLKFG